MSESTPAKRFPTPTPISTRNIEPPEIPTVRQAPPLLPEPAKVEPPLAPMPVRKKKVIVKKVVKKVKKSASTTEENDASSVPAVFRSRPPIIPNLPDVVMRKIFSMLTYKELCGIESESLKQNNDFTILLGVCRRWMNIMNTQWRKQIHEICIERVSRGNFQITKLQNFSSAQSIQQQPSASLFVASMYLVHRTRSTSWLASSDEVVLVSWKWRRIFISWPTWVR